MKHDDGRDYFLKVKKLEGLYDNMSIEIINRMIARLQVRGTVDLLDNPYIWQLEKLNDMHLLTEDVVKAIAERSKISEQVFRDVIENEGFKVYKDSHEQLANDLKLNVPMDEYGVQHSLNALVDQAIYDIDNMLNTTLPKSVQSGFKDVLEQTVANVVAGAETQDQALSKAILKLHDTGFTGFIDKSGRRWKPDVYARMIVKTTTRRAYRSMREKSAEDLGIDTYYYSKKWTARELCAPLQHRIVTKGQARTEQGIDILALSDYGWGRFGGCLGVNCGHYLTPFVIGVNELPDLDPKLAKLTEEEAQENAEAEAKQRAFEREIRKNKERMAIAKEFNNAELLQKAKLKEKMLRGGMKRLIESNKFLHREYARERYYKPAKNLNEEKTSDTIKSKRFKNVIKKLTSKEIKVIREKYLADNIYKNSKDISKYKIFDFDNLWELEPFFNANENFNKWYKKLTELDKRIIASYTEVGDKIYNQFLRKGNLEGITDTTFLAAGIEKNDVERNISKLKSAIKGYKIPDNVVVHRGLKTLPEHLGNIKVGKVYTLDKGFMSTSADESFPRQFLQDDIKYLYRFKLNKGDEIGAYINDISVHNDEYEFLIQPNTKFIASKMYDENNGGYDVKVIEWEVYDERKGKIKGNFNKRRN